MLSFSDNMMFTTSQAQILHTRSSSPRSCSSQLTALKYNFTSTTTTSRFIQSRPIDRGGGENKGEHGKETKNL